MESEFGPDDWDLYALWYDSLNELRPYASMLDDVVRALDGAQTPILDAGCGTGNLIRRLPKRPVTGIDSSKSMLQRAREKCPDAELLETDLGNLPFEERSFGAVACVNTLYALREPAQALREFCRVLRPGGTLVAATPKRGYENGLILKCHAESRLPDDCWANLHLDAAREDSLVREAIPEPQLARRFLQIVRFNRRIAAASRHHFFEERELEELVAAAGFRIVSHRHTYARQSHLIVARKP